MFLYLKTKKKDPRNYNNYFYKMDTVDFKDITELQEYATNNDI